MANPLYNMLGNQQPQNNMISVFQNFMQQMKGKNPHDILQNVISSGKINQEQLNQLQGQANQIMSQFDSLKNMFGFK